MKNQYNSPEGEQGEEELKDSDQLNQGKDLEDNSLQRGLTGEGDDEEDVAGDLAGNAGGNTGDE